MNDKLETKEVENIQETVADESVEVETATEEKSV